MKKKNIYERFISKFRPEPETDLDSLRDYFLSGREVERWLLKEMDKDMEVVG